MSRVALARMFRNERDAMLLVVKKLLFILLSKFKMCQSLQPLSVGRKGLRFPVVYKERRGTNRSGSRQPRVLYFKLALTFVSCSGIQNPRFEERDFDRFYGYCKEKTVLS